MPAREKGVQGSEIGVGFLLQVKAHGWYMSRDTWRVRFTGEMGQEKLPKNKYYFWNTYYTAEAVSDTWCVFPVIHTTTTR